VVGINIWEEENAAKSAREFKEKHKLTYPILLDTEAKYAEKFSVEGVPTNVIIDKEGKVVYLQAGFDKEGLECKLKEVLGVK